MAPRKSESTTRMRLVGWNVQPVIMADDGDNLTNIPVQATQIPAAGWEEFKAGGDQAALEELREQVENATIIPTAQNGSATST
jgi:hypothetical protein